jgi:hypothetical protein
MSSSKNELALLRSMQELSKKGLNLKAGESTQPGDGLAVVRYATYQTNNPKSGNTKNTVPVYGKVTAQPSAQAPAKPAAAPTPAPAPAPPPKPTPAMEEAAARVRQAQETVYTGQQVPKLLTDGAPGEAIKQVSDYARGLGVYNNEYSFATKTIGDAVSDNFDQQVASFSRGIPSPPKPEDGVAKAFGAAGRLMREYNLIG